MNKTLKKAVSLGLVISVLGMATSQIAIAQSNVVQLRPTSSTGNYLAGLEAINTLDSHRAARYFMRAAETAWDNPLYTGRAFLAYLMAGEVSNATSIAQHVLNIDPGDELARLALGAVALKERRFSSAVTDLSKMADASLVGITGAVLKAWAQVGAGDIKTAQKTMRDVSAGGFEEFLVFHSAIMADVAGDKANAIAFAKEAYEIDPFVPRIAEAYVRILGNAGRFKEAQAVLDRFDAEGIVHPIIEELKNPIAAKQKPGAFAKTVQAGAAEMLHGLGAALSRDGSQELGVVFLNLALYLDPQSSIVALSLGEMLSNSKRYDEADVVLNGISQTSPLRLNALIRLAENQDRRDNREEAIKRLQNIIVAYPDSLDALGVLGDTLRYDEQWDEAAEVYSKIIDKIDETKPSNWRYFYVRAIALERAKRWEEAEPLFRKALELNPDQPHVLNYLGYSLVDQHLKLDEALGMIEKAVEMMPMDGYIVDSLGWAFYRLDRNEEAVVALEKAVNLLPDDPELNDHLGDAYWKVGRQREAYFQWSIAVSVDEAGPVTERATKKLEQGLNPSTETDAE